jgi:Bacterial regulatory proteins, tetR family
MAGRKNRQLIRSLRRREQSIMRVQHSTTIHPTHADPVMPQKFTLSPPSGKTRKGNTDREALIAAAADLFARNGFKDTTLRQIAASARRPLSAIRREFNGKSGLLEAVLPVLGPVDLPGLLRDSQHPSLRQDICDLVEWEANRMQEQRHFLDGALSQDGADPALTRIAGTLSFSSASVIIERLKRHRNMTDSERQFLMYAIQAVGFALGFMQADTGLARTRGRVKQLASILSDSIQRHDPLPANPAHLVHSLLPV